MLSGATNQFHAAAGPSVAGSPRVTRLTPSHATEYRASATPSSSKPLHAARPNLTAVSGPSSGPARRTSSDANYPTSPSSRHEPSRRLERRVVAAERAQTLEAELEHARAVAIERGATATAAVTHAAQLSEALAEREAAEALEAKEALLAREHKWAVAAVSQFAAKASLTDAERYRMREDGINAMQLRRANELKDERLHSTASMLVEARHSAAACRRKQGGGKKRNGKKKRTGSGKKKRNGKKQATAIAADGPLPRIAAGGPLLEGLLEGPVSRGARPSLPLDLRLPKLPEMPNVSEVPESPPQPTPKVRDHAPPAATVLLLPFPTELPPRSCWSSHSPSPERAPLSRAASSPPRAAPASLPSPRRSRFRRRRSR